MNKNVLFSVVFLLIANLGFAQIQADVTEVSDFLIETVGKDFHVKIKNASSETQTIKWERIENFPSGWTALVCDPTNCFPPAILTNSGYTLEAGATASYKYTVTASSQSQGTSEFKFSFVSDPSQTVSVNYTFNAVAASSDDLPSVENVKVYPNPAADYIQLSVVDGVSSMEIYNLIGKKVKIFETGSISDKYNISNLPRGMYLVRLLDSDGDALVTKRISKN